MANVEMVVRAAPNGVAQPVGGMGILRLLRRWPADRAPEPVALTVVAWTDLAIDRRASALALVRTLADWRAAQRRLDRLVMDSLDWTQTKAEVAALRATHHRLFSELRGVI